MTRVTILVGDCRDRLRELAAGKLQAVLTSPPYWGLRDYGERWQLGHEPTPDLYVAEIVEVFREVRRVLRPDGVAWLNLGDSFDALQAAGIPWRVAFALQADGWYLRGDIIWSKPSCMPESVNGWRWERHRVKVKAREIGRAVKVGATGIIPGRNTPGSTNRAVGSFESPDCRAQWADCPGCDKCAANDGYVLRRGNWRPTRAHEYVFQLAKETPYFCDAEAVRESAIKGVAGSRFDAGKTAAHQLGRASKNERVESPGRNARSVWHIATQPFRGAHFAVMAPDLAHKCLAASLPYGACPECGAPWARVVERNGETPASHKGSFFHKGKTGTHQQGRASTQARGTAQGVGFRPSCACDAGDPVPATVLDPFGGAGTTALEAVKLGHNAVLVELNPEYAEMAQRRIYDELGKMFVEVEIR
jgi:hypothetical protein